MQCRRQLRAFQLGDNSALLDIVTDIGVEFENTASDTRADIDAIGGNLALHYQRRRARRKPKQNTKNDEGHDPHDCPYHSCCPHRCPLSDGVVRLTVSQDYASGNMTPVL